MSRQGSISFLGNSMANLLVGAATLGYAVIVPAAVVRSFGPDLYGTWYLAFQVAAYVVLLDLGSQYVVTNEAATPGADRRAARLTTAAVLAQSALAVLVLGIAAGWAALTNQGTLARLMAVLGVAAIASLLASTVRAWFGGLERAHVPAVWLIGARLASVVGLGLALTAGSGLVTLIVAVAAPQLVVCGGLLLWARRPPSLWARPDRAAFVRLLRRSAPLALWTISGIVIAGVDIFVVRVIDPAEVGRYAVALPLLAIPTGAVTATMTAWMPRLARAEAGDPHGGQRPTLVATTVMAAALSVGAIPFVAFAEDLVRLWAGPGDWDSAATYLRLLYLASCLRFVFLPWSMLVVVRGEQGRITAAPPTEAVVNLAASIVLGAWLGAVGVALGTLVGAAFAAVIYLAWAVPRTARSRITPPALARAIGGAWLPFAATAALAAVALGGAGPLWRGAVALAVVTVDAWWMIGRRRSRASATTSPPRAAAHGGEPDTPGRVDTRIAGFRPDDVLGGPVPPVLPPVGKVPIPIQASGCDLAGEGQHTPGQTRPAAGEQDGADGVGGEDAEQERDLVEGGSE